MFKDRKDAAEKLALALQPYQNENALVLGIPNGGIEIAYYLAKILHGDLSFIVTRELRYPANPDTCFGAIAEDGSEYIPESAKRHLSMDQVPELVEKEKRILQTHIKALRYEHPFPAIDRRLVILTDDGSTATPALLLAIELCKKNFASKIIVAIPEGNAREEQSLHEKADEVHILEKLHFYTSVTDAYERYTTLSETDALFFLKKWEEEEQILKSH